FAPSAAGSGCSACCGPAARTSWTTRSTRSSWPSRADAAASRPSGSSTASSADTRQGSWATASLRRPTTRSIATASGAASSRTSWRSTAGSSHPRPWSGPGARAGRSAPASAPVVLFLGEQYDAHTQRHEVEPYVRALCDAALEVRLKPHPAAAQAPVPHAAGRSGREPTVVAGPLEELIAEADVVVASFSSAIFDAILHARPVVLFATSRYRDPHGLAAAGAAGLAASPAEIVERVVAAAALPAQELERRRGL